MNTASMKLEVGAHSETGYVRDENQDRMSGSSVPMGHLYIVADGMGGHKGGALAAELTVRGLQRQIGQAAPDATVGEVLKNAFAAANAEVHQKANCGDPATEKMGSTAVLALIQNRTAWLAHVGDSRAYLYRKGHLSCLTKDHTWVQIMVDKGVIKAEDAQDHPNASQLSRAMGHEPHVEVEIGKEFQIRDGDALLLCSDGLCGYVSDAEIAGVLKQNLSVQQLPTQLVQLALNKGGEDNITVQFIQCGQRPNLQKNRIRATAQRKSTKAKSPMRPVFQWILALLSVTIPVLVGYYHVEMLRLSETAAEFERNTKNLRAAISSLTEEADQRNQNSEALKKKDQMIAQLNEDLAKARTDVKNMNSRVTTAEKDRDNYKRKHNALAKKYKKTDGKLKTTTAELAKLKKAKKEPVKQPEGQKQDASGKSKATGKTDTDQKPDHSGVAPQPPQDQYGR